MSHMASGENLDSLTEALDRRLTGPTHEDSGTSNCDYKGESLWGTPTGPQERLAGASIPDFYAPGIPGILRQSWQLNNHVSWFDAPRPKTQVGLIA